MTTEAFEKAEVLKKRKEHIRSLIKEFSKQSYDPEDSQIRMTKVDIAFRNANGTSAITLLQGEIPVFIQALYNELDRLEQEFSAL